MSLLDFEIGLVFTREGQEGVWEVTDVGRRTMRAIRRDVAELPNGGVMDPVEAATAGLYDGPPYGVAEISIDEREINGCRLAMPGRSFEWFSERAPYVPGNVASFAILAIPSEDIFKLCYVRENPPVGGDVSHTAFFSTRKPEQVVGEGWNVEPRQFKASDPYPPNWKQLAAPAWINRTMTWTGGALRAEATGIAVLSLNRRACPWLTGRDVVRIHAGMPLPAVRFLVERQGGSVIEETVQDLGPLPIV